MKLSMGQLYLNSTSEVAGAQISRLEPLHSASLSFRPIMVNHFFKNGTFEINLVTLNVYTVINNTSGTFKGP